MTDSLFLGVNQAIPCGLIVNELCTNVLRHAFPGGTEHARRELHVSLSRVQDDRVALRVADTGIGIPPDLDPDTAPGGGTFFTISYAVIDLETGRVRMVRATRERLVSSLRGTWGVQLADSVARVAAVSAWRSSDSYDDDVTLAGVEMGTRE